MPEQNVRTLVMYPDATVKARTVTSLKEWQEIVGGLIEPIFGNEKNFGEWEAYVNDEGLYACEPNVPATVLADAIGWKHFAGDILHGPVAFVGPVDEDGYSTHISDWLIFLIALGIAIAHNTVGVQELSNAAAATPEQVESLVSRIVATIDWSEA
jgi:hypothetical protein